MSGYQATASLKYQINNLTSGWKIQRICSTPLKLLCLEFYYAKPRVCCRTRLAFSLEALMLSTQSAHRTTTHRTYGNLQTVDGGESVCVGAILVVVVVVS